MKNIAAFFFLALLPVISFAHDRRPPLETVPYVDMNRYLGQWFEIASYPQDFSRGCTATTATYTLRDDGDIDVLNMCRVGRLDGHVRTAHGHAWPLDETNSKLKVRFFWPFTGDYWIIELGQNYEYAVVGHPSRDYLWILSRTPHMDTAVYDGILERLRAKHRYGIERLRKTLQP